MRKSVNHGKHFLNAAQHKSPTLRKTHWNPQMAKFLPLTAMPYRFPCGIYICCRLLFFLFYILSLNTIIDVSGSFLHSGIFVAAQHLKSSFHDLLVPHGNLYGIREAQEFCRKVVCPKFFPSISPFPPTYHLING